jgi:hypothetical protein
MDDLNDTAERRLAELLATLRRKTLDPSDPGRLIQDLQVALVPFVGIPSSTNKEARTPLSMFVQHLCVRRALA